MIQILALQGQMVKAAVEVKKPLGEKVLLLLDILKTLAILISYLVLHKKERTQHLNLLNFPQMQQ
jgi:hypothetical protein